MEENKICNLNIETLIKKFPRYKWKDFSNESHDILLNMVKDDCINNEELVGFVKRNKLNEHFFTLFEMQELKIYDKMTDMKILIFNKDNYIYIQDESTNLFMFISNYLLDVKNCSMCKCFVITDDYNKCECGSIICTRCSDVIPVKDFKKCMVCMNY